MKTENPAQTSAHGCAALHTCSTKIAPSEAIEDAQHALSRRSFVKTFALLSAGSLLGGSELGSILVAEVRAQSSTLPGLFRLNLDNFPTTIKNVGGSVRLAVAGMPTASFPQIIVSRTTASQFFAVTSRCTHQQQTVNAMNSAGRLFCPSHGSQFQPDGTLINGPAAAPLTRYTTTFDGDKIVTVEIPGLGFLVNATTVSLPQNQKRFRLQFPTVNTIRYRVQFRSSLNSGAWAEVPFSTTQEGALTQTVLTGNNAPATVFVQPSAVEGFYAISRANS